MIPNCAFFNNNVECRLSMRKSLLPYSRHKLCSYWNPICKRTLAPRKMRMRPLTQVINHQLDLYYNLQKYKCGYRPTKVYENIYVLADLGALRAPLPAIEPWIGGVEQTQTVHKSKLRTNPNCAQTQTSNKPKVRTNLNFE